MSEHRQFDLCVIGAGPAGQKAAIQAAKAGRRVVIVDRLREVGGACVHTGTIPSKALREQALRQRSFARTRLPASTETSNSFVEMHTLLGDVDQIIAAHDRYMGQQLARNGITCLRGVARFIDGATLEVRRIDGSRYRIVAPRFVIAVGSRPRAPDGIEIDHENVLDSDSILSLAWLPRSLIVLGSGVIASEYACMFSALGCAVTQIDRAPRPLGFLDAEIIEHYLVEFRASGAVYLGDHACTHLAWDGVSQVQATLSDGSVLCADKVLVALGRVANIDGLGLAAAGVKVTARGHVAVDDEFLTSAPGIYAAGDVIGPPSLASAAMEQGRIAACHALGLLAGERPEQIPTGVYTIPEIASVGLSEVEATHRHGSALVGRARYAEIARGQISGTPRGLLRMIADPGGRKLLGVQVIGECAAELVHVAQIALAGEADVDTFVDQVFNFPTYAEAYRVAALDVVRQRRNVAAPSVETSVETGWEDAIAAI